MPPPLEDVWTNIQKTETLLMQTSRRYSPSALSEYIEEFDLERKTLSLLVRMACGFNPDKLSAADYFVRYPFSSVEAIGAGLDDLVACDLAVAKGDGTYALTELGKRIVSGSTDTAGVMIESLDLGDMTPAEAERLLDYDRRILEGIQAASRPHGKPVFTHRMQGLHPSYEPPALWHHWQYIWTMLAASEDEEEYVRKLRGMEPMVWFVRRQVWFTHRRPWRARCITLDDLVRRAVGYSPVEEAEAVCARAVQDLEGRGWLEMVDGAYRLTEQGLTVCDEDERQVEAYLVSMWPELSDDEVSELFDLAIRFNERLEELFHRKLEEENIRKTLEMFVEGLRTLDYDKISKAFYKEGQSIGVTEGQIRYVLRDHWKEMGEQARAEEKDDSDATAQYEIKSLEVIGNAASVIVDLAFGTGNEINERYTDFFHMLKVGEKWVIVNKVYPTSR